MYTQHHLELASVLLTHAKLHSGARFCRGAAHKHKEIMKQVFYPLCCDYCIFETSSHVFVFLQVMLFANCVTGIQVADEHLAVLINAFLVVSRYYSNHCATSASS